MAKFNVALWDGRPETMAAYCGKLSAGVMLTHEEIADLKEFTDVLIYAKAHPNDFVPFGYKKVGHGFMPEDAVPPTPIPPTPEPPPSGDPLASFQARQAVSQNCAWVQITPEESGALLAKYGGVVHQYNQFYTVGGSGGLGVWERPEAASPTGYVYVDAGDIWQHDVHQAADTRVAEIAASQNPPRAVPPPLV